MPTSTMDTYISDGNITLFFGMHTNTFKEDILNSSLLGQLNANLKSTTIDAWLHTYKKILGSIFWTTKSDAALNPLVKSASMLKLAKISLVNYLSTTQLDQLAQCFAYIKQLPASCDVVLATGKKFQSNDLSKTQPTTVNCPLLSIVREDKMIISLLISFETTEPVTIGILDKEIPLKKPFTPPQIRQWVTYLGEENYAGIRGQVIEKLGNNVKTKLVHLDAV